jgi:hypothetical protein
MKKINIESVFYSRLIFLAETGVCRILTDTEF